MNVNPKNKPVDEVWLTKSLPLLKLLMQDDPDGAWSLLQDEGVEIDFEDLNDYFEGNIKLKEAIECCDY